MSEETADVRSEKADEKRETESATSFDPKIKEMMEMLFEWHESRIEQLERVINADENTTIQVQGEAGEPIAIEGDKLTGFKAGCSLAVELFSSFPVSMSSIERTCRECGCTDLDCSDCLERTGVPCHWVGDDLCSACTETE